MPTIQWAKPHLALGKLPVVHETFFMKENKSQNDVFLSDAATEVMVVIRNDVGGDVKVVDSAER